MQVTEGLDDIHLVQLGRIAYHTPVHCVALHLESQRAVFGSHDKTLNMLAIPQRAVSVQVCKHARDAARRQLDKQRESSKLRNDADALAVVSAAARG